MPWVSGKVGKTPVRVYEIKADMVPPPEVNTIIVGVPQFFYRDAATGEKIRYRPGDRLIDDGNVIRLASKDDVVEIDPPPPPEPQVAGRAPRPPIRVNTDTIISPMPAGPFEAGDILGTIYVFDKGEGLPVHVHSPLRNHLTVVAKGRLVCAGRPNIEGVIIEAGQIINWTAGEPHGFTALEPSILIQVRKVDQ
jgi:quercetin dioxygenase-like cupin family protein